MIRILPALLIILAILSGCASMQRGMYENIKNRNEVTRSPGERAINPTPGYDEYKKERERINGE